MNTGKPKKPKAKDTSAKSADLARNTEDGSEQMLTTNQGVRINDNQNSLQAGERGPTLLEDFIFREKITHFHHERIPERIVHARGAAAHGYFQVYESMAPYTKAHFLQDPALKTPVFVRFSTVAGFRGSTDLARDVRGFAVKFYTEEGNYDLVGNNIPVFFIQDAIKFPDLVHAVKPEPHNEIPQAASAHDTFWDFISLKPESMHMIMWAMSDRAIPRSYRMMEGFGVHTFRFVNAAGKGTFVKFHWNPLLEGRLFSYLDTQLKRLGGPNFHEIPINRPVAPLHNNQRDGHMRQTINRGRVAYDPNSLGGGCPFQAKMAEGGFASYAERIDASKVRARSASFFDHFSQARLFFNSQSVPEQNHIVNALRFELGKVETPAIRERMVYLLAQVDKGLANRVAEGLGIAVPAMIDGPVNQSIPADANPNDVQPKPVAKDVGTSPALSMANGPKDTIKPRKIAVLAADGFDAATLSAITKALTAAGAQVKLVAPRLGMLKGVNGDELKIDFSLLTSASVLFDALYVAGGEASVTTLKREAKALHFINEAYLHCKAIAATGAGVDLVNASHVGARLGDANAGKPKDVMVNEGVVLSREAPPAKVAAEFIKAIAEHRRWSREMKEQVPA